MSYLGTGVSKLTEAIYVALEDAKFARQQFREVRQRFPGDDFQVDSAVRAMVHASAYASGLVGAWEIVTGEIWGEATWQPTGGRG